VKRRAVTFGFQGAGSLKWVTDADLLYVGAVLVATVAGTSLLVSTDTNLTRAQFVAQSGITFDVLDYMENSQQINARLTSARGVFLPQGTNVALVASATLIAICYFEEVPAEITAK